MLKKLPSDSEIVNMDPALKSWLFYSWFNDKKEKLEELKNHALLISSFINPQAVRKMLDAQSVSTSENEFEESLEFIKDPDKQLELSNLYNSIKNEIS